jgi:hypothetical protein
MLDFYRHEITWHLQNENAPEHLSICTSVIVTSTTAGASVCPPDQSGLLIFPPTDLWKPKMAATLGPLMLAGYAPRAPFWAGMSPETTGLLQSVP